MGGYLVNFSVYTFAMIGFLFIAVAIYKKANLNTKSSNKTGGLEVEESLALSPRKRLHVVRVNGEKFLIAADIERTEFLAKLDSNENILNQGTTIQDNVVQLNRNSELVSSNNKIAEFQQRVKKQKVSTPLTQGNTALKTNPSILSRVKSNHIKKPAMMREILRKLEVPQG